MGSTWLAGMSQTRPLLTGSWSPRFDLHVSCGVDGPRTLRPLTVRVVRFGKPFRTDVVGLMGCICDEAEGPNSE